MKKLATAIGIAALTLSSLSFAMPGDNGDRQGPPCGGHMAQLLDKIGASTSQQENIKEIFEGQRKDRKNLRQALRHEHRKLHKLDPVADNYSTEATAIASEIGRLISKQVLQKAETRRLVALQLTAEQREELAELRDDMHEECDRNDDIRGPRSGHDHPHRQ